MVTLSILMYNFISPYTDGVSIKFVQLALIAKMLKLHTSLDPK
jgi:hypothetical protein